MSNPSNRTSMRGQLTLRGVVIGVLGCVIITASSAYTALKMGVMESVFFCTVTFG